MVPGILGHHCAAGNAGSSVSAIPAARGPETPLANQFRPRNIERLVDFFSAGILRAALLNGPGNSGFGLLNWLAAPWWIAVPVTLLVRSLANYGFHVISHKVPLLWRLHRVHHCDVHLDISSALRTHPIELIVLLVFTLPVVAIFGLSAVALAAYECVEVIANVVTHANIRLPKTAERYAGWRPVTPAVHRLHHSSLQVETDSNYGNVFSFCDGCSDLSQRSHPWRGVSLRARRSKPGRCGQFRRAIAPAFYPSRYCSAAAGRNDIAAERKYRFDLAPESVFERRRYRFAGRKRVKTKVWNTAPPSIA